MTTLQIVLLSIAGAFTVASIVFMIMFIVEISASSKEENEEAEVKSIFSSENYVKEEKKEESVYDMLAKLDEQASETAPVEEKAEEPVEEKVEETETVENNAEEATEEVKEETAETVAEPVEETETVENNAEEATEETEEVAEAEAETEEVAETEAETVEEAKEETTEEVETSVESVEETELPPISPANLLDYKARLEKVIENRDKINKDLIKVEKSILNYERTKRRKARNQKMLDRRASELTNLNLVMYSVTDIKNVDEDKKIKQEELTSHIAELKASIQDAEEFLDSNKEKNDHDVKMAKFLIQEKSRYNEEIAELEKLIAKTEGTAA